MPALFHWHNMARHATNREGHLDFNGFHAYFRSNWFPAASTCMAPALHLVQHMRPAPQIARFRADGCSMSEIELLPSRLTLILEASPALKVEDVQARVSAGDVAALILTTDGAALPALPHLRALAAPAQHNDTAVLICDDADMARKAGLDGVHVSDATPSPLKAALSALKPDSIVGAGGLMERHSSMEAGESGADYVMFGALAPAEEDTGRIRAMVGWWAELCEVPCIGVATAIEEVEELARLGADFIALPARLTAGPQGPQEVARAQKLLEQGHAARLEALTLALAQSEPN